MVGVEMQLIRARVEASILFFFFFFFFACCSREREGVHSPREAESLG